ncbi:MAG: dockerin type I domain-containing protein [Planctomycetota bacterium]
MLLRFPTPLRWSRRSVIHEDRTAELRPRAVTTLVATFALGLCVLASTPALEAQTFRRGDVNDDAAISLFDACAIQRFLFVGTPLPCPDAADVDDNGIVQLADAVLLTSYLCIPMSPPPAAPGPLICGLDPTADTLPPCNYLTCATPVPPPNSRFIRGDCDLSLSIALGDGITMLNILFGTTAMPCANACDANGDGAVNIGDPLYLLTFLFAGGPPPPAPFPNCGCDTAQCPVPLDCTTSNCP